MAQTHYKLDLKGSALHLGVSLQVPKPMRLAVYCKEISGYGQNAHLFEGFSSKYPQLFDISKCCIDEYSWLLSLL
jgi:hypothetical protein